MSSFILTYDLPILCNLNHKTCEHHTALTNLYPTYCLYSFLALQGIHVPVFLYQFHISVKHIHLHQTGHPLLIEETNFVSLVLVFLLDC